MLIEHIPPEERRKSMNLEQIESFILQQYRDEKITEGSAAMLLGLDRIDLRFLVQTYDFDLILARRIAPGLKRSVDEVVMMIKASRQNAGHTHNATPGTGCSACGWANGDWVCNDKCRPPS